MDDKLSKQSIDRLDISDNTIRTLKDNNIKTIGLLCKKNKSDLRKLEIVQFDIKKIETELQLLGLGLKN
ncbi:MAG: DNA-directed RNA polymerase subunit alpha C-terminal domain-containing protein [Clostridia bacterium]